MEILIWILITLIPFALMGALILFMNRWGAKHDPMGGSSANILSTNGEPPRANQWHD